MGTEPASAFEALPIEIVEELTQLLELRDICSLRLTCWAAATKTSQDVFRSFFRTRTVRADSPRHCRSFSLATARDHGTGLGTLLRELTLRGRVEPGPGYAPSKVDWIPSKGMMAPQGVRPMGSPPRKSDRKPEAAPPSVLVWNERRKNACTRLLLDAFTNIASNLRQGTEDGNGLGKLDCLRLSVEDARPEREYHKKGPGRPWRGDWEPVWQSAEDTFHVVTAVLSATGLRFETLDLFDSTGIECSLAIDVLGRTLARYDLTQSLRDLRRLSLCVSDRRGESEDRALNQYLGLREFLDLDTSFINQNTSFIHPDTGDASNFGAQWFYQTHEKAVKTLLELCPSLTDLGLRWFDLIPCGTTVNTLQQKERNFLKSLVYLKLPSLTTLNMGGLYTDQASLVSFVRCNGTKLRSLHLEDIELVQGRFEPLLRLIRDELARKQHLETFELAHLFLSSSSSFPPMINFLGPKRRTVPLAPGRLAPAEDGPERLQRGGAEVDLPITFAYASYIPVQGWDVIGREEDRRFLYGPPCQQEYY